MNVIDAETVLTIEGSAGEIAEIALHLDLCPSNGEVFVKMEALDDGQILWMENKIELVGLHDSMSLLFIIRKEEEDDILE